MWTNSIISSISVTFIVVQVLMVPYFVFDLFVVVPNSENLKVKIKKEKEMFNDQIQMKDSSLEKNVLVGNPDFC